MTASDEGEKPPQGAEEVDHSLVYTPSANKTELTAEFSNGRQIRVTRDRARVYPGLTSEAPTTRAFYGLVAGLPTGGHVLDAGCGSGIGTRRLCESFGHVSGVDNSREALDFAEQFAPRAHLRQLDLCAGPPADAVDLVFIVDVLGHVADPHAMLRGLRCCLNGGGRVLLAEPAANPAQRLTFPARRSFSRKALTSLFTYCGFELQSWLLDNATFLACVFAPAEKSNWEALRDAEEAALQDDVPAAISALARANESDNPAFRLEATLAEAELRLSLGDGDGAAQAYFRARELDANDARALTGLARISLATGSTHDAFSLAATASDTDPTDPSTCCVLAMAAERLGHPDALNAWRVATHLMPDNVTFAGELARIAEQAQSYALGIAGLERVRKYCDPMPVELHLTLARMMLKAGRKREARLEVRLARALAPDNGEAEKLWKALAPQAG